MGTFLKLILRNIHGWEVVIFTDIIEIKKEGCDIPDFIMDVKGTMEEGIKIVPNPAFDYIDIFVKQPYYKDTPYVIKSSFGQIVKIGVIPAGQLSGAVPLEGPGGIYHLFLSTPSGPLTSKILLLQH